MPTRNFACAELTQAYYDRQRDAGIEIASSIILGVIQSYTNYYSTTMSGHAYSYQSGDLYVGSGQSTTYDYSYIGDRAEDVLRAVAQGGKSTVTERRPQHLNSTAISSLRVLNSDFLIHNSRPDPVIRRKGAGVHASQNSVFTVTKIRIYPVSAYTNPLSHPKGFYEP